MVFNQKICSGAANKSYGIQVAKLAGIPKSVIDTAFNQLSQYEQQENKPALQPSIKQDNPILDILEGIDIDSTTPQQALAYLSELKAELLESDA